MAWGFISVLPITIEQYDAIDAAIAGAPPGLILHTGSRVDGGVRIVDIWDSEADYRRFEQEQLLPAMQSLGGPPPADAPQTEEFDMHAIRGRAA